MVSTTKELRFAHLNIRSLQPKVHKLHDLLIDLRVDLVALSETWLSDLIDDDMICIDGYTVLRCDRGSRGGGVCFYLKSNIKYSVITSSADIEQLWVLLHLRGGDIAVGVAYRPGYVDCSLFLGELDDTIANCLLLTDRILCFGDFNINVLNSGSSDTLRLFCFLNSWEATQLIDCPTRTTALSATLLDLIISFDASLVLSSGVVDCAFSDHDVVFCELAVRATRVVPTVRYLRSIANINLERFTSDLNLIPFDSILRINCVNEKVNYFNRKILSLFDQHAPIKKCSFSKINPPWLTENLKLMMRLRDDAKKRFKRTGSSGTWEYYKDLRNLTSRTVTAEKRAYFEFVTNGVNNKNVWRRLESLNVKRRKHVDLPCCLKQVSELNNFFVDGVADVANSFCNVGYDGDAYDCSPFPDRNYEFLPVTADAIKDIIYNSKSSSAGSDGLSSQMIKLCCPTVLPYITHIINSCLIESTVPDCWKFAIVKPIPKNSKPLSFNDLRPVSILPFLCKVFERVIQFQLSQFANLYDILPPTQSGFREGHSCTTAMLAVTDDIMEATDRGDITIMTLLDYSKAFDTVNHLTLLKILKYFGLSESGRQLLGSYLSGRCQAVQIDNMLSAPRPVEHGVPQGSIVAPLLYTLYTSLIFKGIKFNKFHMYADDTQLFYSFKPEEYIAAQERINLDLHTLWATSNMHQLKLNPAKSAVVLFGNRRVCAELKNLININIDGCTLPFVDEAKSLGLSLSNDFRYVTQISRYIKNAYMGLRMIYPHRSCLPTRLRTRLCEALVLSHFNYLVPVYHPAISALDAKRIQMVQNNCLRFIYNIRKYDSITYKLTEAGWLSMGNRRQLHTLLFYKKLINSEIPEYLFNKIRFNSLVRSRDTRGRYDIYPPYHRTSMFKRSFSYHIYKSYNELPVDLRIADAARFRRRLYTGLLESQSLIIIQGRYLNVLGDALRW